MLQLQEIKQLTHLMELKDLHRAIRQQEMHYIVWQKQQVSALHRMMDMYSQLPQVPERNIKHILMLMIIGLTMDGITV